MDRMSKQESPASPQGDTTTVATLGHAGHNVRAETRAALGDVASERRHQDEKWGGPAHDDNHSGADWSGFIIDRAAVLQDDYDTGNIREQDARRLILEIAALAAAWLEAHDRQCGRGGEGVQP